MLFPLELVPYAWPLLYLEGLCQGQGGSTFEVVLLSLKGRHLRIHCRDAELSFSQKRISVTQITTERMAQTERKGGSNY